MSNAAEKARYFLEKAAPQLKDFEDKGIFTRDEIRALVTTRSEHEHRVLSPRSTADMWLAYIDWDINLESLRARRCQKLHIHNSSAHVGETRIFKTFDRATERHQGSMLLWTRYLDFADKKGAGKRWNKVWNRAVRLHSRSAELWIIGARKMADNGDMSKSRERFMYGCRNCVGENAARVWVEYAKVELEWLAKTEKKLKLGKYTVDLDGDYMALGGGHDSDSEIDDEEDDDDLAAPTREQRMAVHDAAAKQLAKSSALEGAIPRAIFDVARKQDFFSPRVAMMFWDTFAKVENASKKGAVLQHVVSGMEEMYPQSPEAAFCRIRMPLVGAQGVAWGKGLKEVLGRLGFAFRESSDANGLASLICPWLQILISDENTGPFVPILEETRKRIVGVLEVP